MTYIREFVQFVNNGMAVAQWAQRRAALS